MFPSLHSAFLYSQSPTFKNFFFDSPLLACQRSYSLLLSFLPYVCLVSSFSIYKFNYFLLFSISKNN
jgi:hypothetical protein